MAHYTPAPVTLLRPAPLVLALALAAPLPARGAETVGPETCRACHPTAYEAWATSPHARSREALPERSRNEPRCLVCHAPDAQDGLAGVSCEACHGPGRVYTAPYVMRDAELARAVGLVDPGPKTCAACHTDSTPSLERFEYDRKLLLIRHGKEPAPPPPQPTRPAPPKKAPAR
jgi:formate-dependent nitrite reductase cytochrome c552 subunit